MAQLAQAWGPAVEHRIVAHDQHYGAEILLQGLIFSRLGDFPLRVAGLARRLRQVGTALASSDADLVCTYNWGAMDVVLANRLFGRRPLVHHEDGFGPQEAVRQLPKRVLFRRLALPGADAIVCCSQNLLRIARDIWHQPPGRLHFLPNGVAIDNFISAPAQNAIPGLVKKPGELLVGSVAKLRPEKNFARLLQAFAQAAKGKNARLVIVGDGDELPKLQSLATQLGIQDQTLFPGFLAHPHLYLGLFDLFAMSSDTEQFPISLVEAMAAGLPALTTNVGDIRHILPVIQSDFIISTNDESAYTAALTRLLDDAGVRHTLAEANRAAAQAFTETAMVDRYAALYSRISGRQFPSS